MAFPTNPIGLTVELLLNGVWVNVTSRYYAPADLRWQVGRPNPAGVTPATIALTLKNQDGALTWGNPGSPYWPNIRRNVKLRLTVNAGVGPALQLTGYVHQWPTRRPGNSKHQRLAEITAQGILETIGQADRVMQSALSGSIGGADLVAKGIRPVAYYPLEDGQYTTEASSPIPGVPTMTATRLPTPPGFDPSMGLSAVQFAAVEGPPGSSRLPDFSKGGQLTGTVPPGAGATFWRVQFVAKIAPFPDPSSGFVAPVQWKTTTGQTWEMFAEPIGLGGLGFIGPGTTAFGAPPFAIDDDQWHEWRIEAAQSGPDVNVTVKIDGVTRVTKTITGVTLARVATVNANAGASASALIHGLGHITVWGTAVADVDLDTVRAMGGYAGELLTDRLTRVAAQAAIPLTIVGSSAARMGVQPTNATPLAILGECVDVDAGELVDGLGDGLTYYTRAAGYNLPAALVVDVAGRQFAGPWEPDPSDQDIRNDVLVTRKNGGSYRAVDSTSAAGTGANGVGRAYPDSPTINIADDLALPNQAGWRLHVGTWAEKYQVPRMPTVPLKLHTVEGSALLAAFMTAAGGVRWRVDLVNPPAGDPPFDLQLLVEGYTATIRRRREFEVELNCVPYGPNVVAAIGTTFRLEMSGQTLAAPLNPGAVTLSLATVAGNPVHTRSDVFPADFPHDLNVAGWRITVRTNTTPGSPQALGIDPAPNTSTIPAGTPVTLWRPAPLA